MGSYANAAFGGLPAPSGDTRDFQRFAVKLLSSVWKDGLQYVKAGVMLHDCCPTAPIQLSLLGNQGLKRDDNLMAAVDIINHRGAGHIFWANQGTFPSWLMRRKHLSPAYAEVSTGTAKRHEERSQPGTTGKAGSD